MGTGEGPWPKLLGVGLGGNQSRLLGSSNTTTLSIRISRSPRHRSNTFWTKGSMYTKSRSRIARSVGKGTSGSRRAGRKQTLRSDRSPSPPDGHTKGIGTDPAGTPLAAVRRTDSKGEGASRETWAEALGVPHVTGNSEMGRQRLYPQGGASGE